MPCECGCFPDRAWCVLASSSAELAACANASKLGRSLPESPAASTTTLSDCKSSLMSALPSWVNAAGLFSASRSIAATARSNWLPMCTSSFSLAMKSAASFCRSSVAFASSAVLEAMDEAKSSILVVEASMVLPNALIFASSFPFRVVAVLIMLFVLCAASSHHSKYSLYSAAARSPSSWTLADREARRSMTICSGLPRAPFAIACGRVPATQAKTVSMTAWGSFIAADRGLHWAKLA
mmetsp:Transcript_18371/g.43183  ORF Transcript_18371/g.43183 Transcript_18371/m.43183 type:complete len:238 (+) Transcript_18371:1505-2218(+)